MDTECDERETLHDHPDERPILWDEPSGMSDVPPELRCGEDTGAPVPLPATLSCPPTRDDIRSQLLLVGMCSNHVLCLKERRR